MNLLKLALWASVFIFHSCTNVESGYTRLDNPFGIVSEKVWETSTEGVTDAAIMLEEDKSRIAMVVDSQILYIEFDKPHKDGKEFLSFLREYKDYFLLELPQSSVSLAVNNTGGVKYLLVNDTDTTFYTSFVSGNQYESTAGMTDWANTFCDYHLMGDLLLEKVKGVNMYSTMGSADSLKKEIVSSWELAVPRAEKFFQEINSSIKLVEPEPEY